MRIPLQGSTIKERREWLYELLHDGFYRITFYRLDGHLRVMTCTLLPTIVPYRAKTWRSAVARRNIKVLSIWDCHKRAWRAFRVDRVLNVEWLPDYKYN